MEKKQSVLANIQIVLVEPRVPENIGLVARVLKNTGITNLSLVKPNLTVKAYEVAKRARDVLEGAKTYASLKEAVEYLYFVFGTTRRKSSDTFIFNFNGTKHLVASLASKKKVGIVFGREDFGLSQKEMEVCDGIFYLAANPDFPSYNLASCVTIVCYELMSLSEQLYHAPALNLSSRQEYETFFSYLKEYLAVQLKKNRVEPSLKTLKRLFLRTCLTKNEIALLKSLFIRHIRSL